MDRDPVSGAKKSKENISKDPAMFATTPRGKDSPSALISCPTRDILSAMRLNGEGMNSDISMSHTVVKESDSFEIDWSKFSEMDKTTEWRERVKTITKLVKTFIVRTGDGNERATDIFRLSNALLLG